MKSVLQGFTKHCYPRQQWAVWPVLIALGILCNCSIKRAAIRSLADALSSPDGTAITAEDDLKIVEQALPFGLKTMESLLNQIPEHKGLHLALAQGYLVYGYAFAELEAEKVKAEDFKEYKRQKQRALRLYKRAFGYAKRGLDLVHSDFKAVYEKDLYKALGLVTQKQDAPLLYWAGASLAKWISLSKLDPAALVRLPETAALMKRGMELDSVFDNGSFQEFFVSYEGRGKALGGDVNKARNYYDQAVKLAGGRKISLLLTYVETFSIPNQNQKEFDEYLGKALVFDLDRYPAFKLANAIAKKKAEILAVQRDDLFVGE